MKMPVVLIDNGHGWNTPGKRSPDGVFREWAWTREIAVNVVEDLKEQGVTAFLLVHEDEDIALATRVARVEGYCREYGSKNVILVSIHNNAAGDGSA
jgi:N-acetylmuramoyl-L-alanine amidase